MINPFRCYQLYTCLKLHFDGKYDVFKYNFKSNATFKAFEKRKDKYFYTKIANKFNNEQELIEFFVSNFIEDVSWIGDCDEAHFLSYKKRVESLSYTVYTDVDLISKKEDKLKYVFSVDDGQIPLITKLYLQGDVCLETVCIFEKYLKFVEKKTPEISDTIVWPSLKTKIVKYEPFLNFEPEKFKKLIENNFVLV